MEFISQVSTQVAKIASYGYNLFGKVLLLINTVCVQCYYDSMSYSFTVNED